MTDGKFVLDTSLFLANQVRGKDQSLEDAVEDLIRSMDDTEAEFYMPKSTMDELVDILEDSVRPELLKDLKVLVSIRSPSRYEVDIPGEMLYRFIEEMRDRTDKGLRLSEKAVRKNPDEVDEPENEHITREDVVISNLRDNYKEKMRKGVIDSGEDIDILLLGRELDAKVVTEDQGIINWCEDLGVEFIKARDFPDLLQKRINEQA
jgi:RNA ligase partner protein